MAPDQKLRKAAAVCDDLLHQLPWLKALGARLWGDATRYDNGYVIIYG